MKNILVTGGAGYIGSHIVELLVKKKYKVFIIDNLSTGFKRLLNKKAKFFKTDINKSNLVRKIIKKNKIDSVIHLAASLNVTEAEKKPIKYFKNNIMGTLSLIEACDRSSVKNFIFSSSCSVYSDNQPYVNETTVTKPKGIYGFTKIMGEEIIKKKYFHARKMNYGILRYFNVAGASISGKIGQIQKNGQLFKNLSMEIIKKRPVFNVYGNDYKTSDGTCIRDYIHVCDLADIHLRTLSKIKASNKSLTLNCGYGRGLSVLEVMNEFKKFSKNKIKINFKNRRSGDMVKVIANTKKLKKILNWKPKYYNLNKIVKSSINWEKIIK